MHRQALAAFDEAHIPTDAIDRKLIATHKVIPLNKRGNRLSVAIADPTNLRALDEIRFQTGLAVDISAVPVLRRETHLPVFVDPSHACGERDLVPPLAVDDELPCAITTSPLSPRRYAPP